MASSYASGQSRSWFADCEPTNTITDNDSRSFDYIARSIIVPGYFEQRSGTRHSANFILDTGGGRTIIDQSLVKQLSLKQVGETELVAPGGTTKSRLVEINLCVGGTNSGTIVAATQDLRPYTRAHKTRIDAILGTDFLKRFTVYIDYAKRRVAFTNKSASNNALIAIVPFQLVLGMPLVKMTLPGAVETFVIIDTGHIMEIMLYDDISDDHLQLQEPFSTRRLGGAADAYVVRIGRIPWIEIGTYRINSVNVGVHPLVTRNLFNTTYKPGLLGNGLLEKYAVEMDYLSSAMRLYASP